MMREIKFRAWTENTWLTDTLKEKMIYDYQDTTLVEVFGFNSEELPVMQFTGLVDKNGKEIYEGDLLSHKLQGIRKVYYPFSDDVASFGIEEIHSGFKNTLQDAFLYEIVGNIYEHSHLLEGSK